MKKWNNPEVVELDFRKTAERRCLVNKDYTCSASGKGQCHNCTINPDANNPQQTYGTYNPVTFGGEEPFEPS